MISKFDIEKYLEIVFRKNIINITKNEMLNLNCITLEFKKTQEDEKTIDISIISNYVNLKNLILENCIIDGIEKLIEFQKLEKLSLLWSEIKKHENTNVFSNLPLLKELYISDYTPEFAKKIPQTIKIYRDYNHLTSLKE